MHPKSQRRVHGAEFKKQVLAECRQPGASVAAVAMAHGLNVNLVHKWLAGLGIKRTGLATPKSVAHRQLGEGEQTPVALQFVPVALAPSAGPANSGDPVTSSATTDIHIELTRAGTQLCVRWPAMQAAACAQWLRELADAVRGG